jgi:hypothetical protein
VDPLNSWVEEQFRSTALTWHSSCVFFALSSLVFVFHFIFFFILDSSTVVVVVAVVVGTCS